MGIPSGKAGQKKDVCLGLGKKSGEKSQERGKRRLQGETIHRTQAVYQKFQGRISSRESGKRAQATLLESLDSDQVEEEPYEIIGN